jgi:hypothetical protein
MAVHDYDLPDARGHFGQYGGVFVAETLIAALDELKEAYAAPSAIRSSSPNSITNSSTMSVGQVRSTTPALVGGARRRADLPEARRPEPHRCAQDQQLHRPGLARPAHGQAARHRRDRCRPARRGDGHRGRALRHGMRGLHGFAKTSGGRRPTSTA